MSSLVIVCYVTAHNSICSYHFRPAPLSHSAKKKLPVRITFI